MTTELAAFFAKLFSRFSQKVLKRGGETWPGEIALKLDPNIGHKLQSCFEKVIYVIGTNGKTSTTKLLVQVLKSQGKNVITNPSGANQLNGIISNILIQKEYSSDTKYIGVFEVDENYFPSVAAVFPPNIVIVLNLFRDQMDRYGEVASITEKWKQVFVSNPKAVLITNASDPGIYALGEELGETVKKYYGVPDVFMQKDFKVFGDYLYCPRCGTKLTYTGIYVSHMGSWACPKGDFKRPKMFTYNEKRLKDLSSLPNYLVINSEAVYLALGEIGLSQESLFTALAKWEPAFGRGESISEGGKRYIFYLGKNPSSWTVVFESLKELNKDTLLVLGLNNRDPDGHDVSWIWDTEINSKFKIQNSKIFVYGDRAYDMAVRLKVEGIRTINLTPEVTAAVREIRKAQENNVVILANYSALLEIRRLITGKAIL
ncbi:MAG: MurT ligase domain-containing protein [Patescibacteria group bacterium]|jgi:UDP-N-acetylmuramyl tripeptide synthase